MGGAESFYCQTQPLLRLGWGFDNYELLEKIRNARIVSFKRDSKELKFNTPNTVIVFSNKKSDVTEVSKDRWVIFQIKDDDLFDVREGLKKKKKKLVEFSTKGLVFFPL